MLAGMNLGRLLMRAAPLFNAPVAALTRSPRWGRLVSGNIAMLTYTGRKSGRTVSLPVGYQRRGDEVTIGVNMPDAKTWWRNFLGDGAPLSLELDGRELAGHGVAQRDAAGRVTVHVRLQR
ncbi:MAG: nitroreductase family deazaflavin-dependent oxidoreductase [Mycobacteriaceae bacterium]|nr:nitroreductase family deazaflavin-dependent oxidoreductase [Mycobacteriaceae bacterium]MBV9641403.1 nitroreductase family deazaflavin-dependent oxidoreductase [Mycobacteriaceae bacterium]